MTPISTARPPLELEMDLASLASLAAIELDDLLLGRRKQFDAVQLLAQRIASGVPDGQPLDDSTVVAMHHALIEDPSGAPTTMTELKTTAAVLSDQMAKLVGEDTNNAMDLIKKLRSFCVALSKHSMAIHRSPYDEKEDPHQV